MLDEQRIPEPWRSFLEEVDSGARDTMDFHCIGGFVITQKYGFIRETADVDLLAIAPNQQLEDLLTLAGKGSSLPLDSLQSVRHFHSRHPPTRLQPNTFPRELIHNRQNPDAHKIHAPALVRCHRNRLRHTLTARDLPPLLRAHDQLFLAVEPVNALRIHLPSLPPQQHRQTSIAITNMRRC